MGSSSIAVCSSVLEDALAARIKRVSAAAKIFDLKIKKALSGQNFPRAPFYFCWSLNVIKGFAWIG